MKGARVTRRKWRVPFFVGLAVVVAISFFNTWSIPEIQGVIRLAAMANSKQSDVRTSETCHSQMIDLYWHLDMELLGEQCAKYEDTYAMGAFADQSPYSCRYAGNKNESIPIPEFRVLGERHSGTNAIRRLMYANFEGTINPDTVHWNGTHDLAGRHPPNIDFGITEHKHDEQTYYRGPESDLPIVGLVAIAVRDPYDWIHSMAKNIYYGEERNKFKMDTGEPFEDALERFLSTAWKGGAHVYDTTFADIFDLRYRKVCNHISSALRYSQYVLYLRQEDDLTDTSKLSVVDAVSRLGWPLSAPQGDVDTMSGQYMGWSKKFASDDPGGEKYDEHVMVDVVNRHADWAFERVLGYLKRTYKPALEVAE